MVAVVLVQQQLFVGEDLLLCRACDKPIARRDGTRLVYQRSGVYLEIEGTASILIQCHHAKRDDHGRAVECRANNRVTV